MHRSALSSLSEISPSFASYLEVSRVTLDRSASWSYVFYCFKRSRSVFSPWRDGWREVVA